MVIKSLQTLVSETLKEIKTINIEFTFFVILTSPKGKTIDFSFKIDSSSFNFFPNVGDEKRF